MPCPKKNRKAKLRRRRKYEGTLERGYMKLAEEALKAKRLMNDALDSERRMRETFMAVLNKQLLVEVSAWQGREKELEVKARFNDMIPYMPPPGMRSYTYSQAAMDVALLRPVNCDVGTRTLRNVIDMAQILRKERLVEYLQHEAKEMGMLIAKEILGKMLGYTNDVLT